MANLNTLNVTRVLRLIWLNRGISRIEISRQLELDKSTITNIVNRLMKQDLVVTLEEGEASTKGGRKPVGLALNEQLGLIIGMEMTTDRIMVTAMDIQGKPLFSRKLAYQVEIEPLEDLFLKAMDDLSDDIASTGLSLMGIGIGFSGLIDPSEGVIHKSIPLNVEESYPFLDKLQDRYQVPVIIDNDANCCCWDEMIQGRCSGYDNFLYVLAEDRHHSRMKTSSRISFAVGLGIVINGRLHHGYGNSAGEFKSILWKEGTINQFSISDEIMANPEENPDAIRDVIAELAAHVGFLANVLNLSIVVLGGLEHYRDEVSDIFYQEIRRNWSYQDQNDCKVCFAGNEEFAVSSGAAGMFLGRMFSTDSSDIEKEGVLSSLNHGYEMIRLLQERIS